MSESALHSKRIPVDRSLKLFADVRELRDAAAQHGAGKVIDTFDRQSALLELKDASNLPDDLVLLFLHAPGYNKATLFSEELSGVTRKTDSFVEQFGLPTLLDLMAIQSAVLNGTFTDLAGGETKVFEVLVGLPNGRQWMEYIRADMMVTDRTDAPRTRIRFKDASYWFGPDDGVGVYTLNRAKSVIIECLLDCRTFGMGYSANDIEISVNGAACVPALTAFPEIAKI